LSRDRFRRQRCFLLGLSGDRTLLLRDRRMSFHRIFSATRLKECLLWLWLCIDIFLIQVNFLVHSFLFPCLRCSGLRSCSSRCLWSNRLFILLLVAREGCLCLACLNFSAADFNGFHLLLTVALLEVISVVSMLLGRVIAWDNRRQFTL